MSRQSRIFLLIVVVLHFLTAVTAFSIGRDTQLSRPAREQQEVEDVTEDQIRSKRSGVSDQRIAELEAYLGMSRMPPKSTHKEVAHGLFDVDAIGKKKRSFQPLESDFTESFLSSAPSAYSENVFFKFLRKLRGRVPFSDSSFSDYLETDAESTN